MKSVVKSLEETVSKIHISDRVDTLWESDGSWKLAVPSSPVVLNSLHMPLVDDNDYLLFRAFVDCCEQVIIPLVNKDLLETWEEDGHGLDEPVHKVRISALLSKLTSLSVRKTRSNLKSFLVPEVHAGIGHSLVEVVRSVHTGLVVQSLPGALAKLSTKEVQFGTLLLSLLASILHLKARSQIVERGRDTEVELEQEGVKVETSPEDGSTGWVPNVKGVELSVFGQVR